MSEKVIQLPEGWEVDKIENGKIVLKEGKLELPKTWGECLKKLDRGEHIGINCNIDKIYKLVPTCYVEDVVPIGYASKFLALMQLITCRNVWWKVLNYTPNWDSKSAEYCITRSNTTSYLVVYAFHMAPHTFAFPSREIAFDFLNTFKDLLIKADDLI